MDIESKKKKKSKKISDEGLIEAKNHAKIVKCKSNDIATELKHIAQHHIDSFNYFIETGLKDIASYLKPVEIDFTENVI